MAEYVFRLTVTDDRGGTDSVDIVVPVNASAPSTHTGTITSTLPAFSQSAIASSEQGSVSHTATISQRLPAFTQNAKAVVGSPAPTPEGHPLPAFQTQSNGALVSAGVYSRVNGETVPVSVETMSDGTLIP